MTEGMALRLKAARVEAGFRSQNAFADAIKKHWQTVSNYENAKVINPSAEVLQKWADITGKTIDYFMEEPIVPDPEPVQPAVHKFPYHPGVEALAQDVDLCRENDVTAQELNSLRRWYMPDPETGEPMILQTRSEALGLLREVLRPKPAPLSVIDATPPGSRQPAGR